MSEVYERLRERLDDLATGFPLSESRVEMKMLQRLFTEEEAELVHAPLAPAGKGGRGSPKA